MQYSLSLILSIYLASLNPVLGKPLPVLSGMRVLIWKKTVSQAGSICHTVITSTSF